MPRIRRKVIAEQFPLLPEASQARKLRDEAMRLYAHPGYTLDMAGQALGLIEKASKIERQLGIAPQIDVNDWQYLKPIIVNETYTQQYQHEPWDQKQQSNELPADVTPKNESRGSKGSSEILRSQPREQLTLGL